MHRRPDRVRQILVNLMGNAIEFTERGLIKVALTTSRGCERRRRRASRGGATRASASGRSASELFEPFMQVDGSTTRRYGGTGLGLAIGRQLAGLMGGEIGSRASPARQQVLVGPAAPRAAPVAARPGPDGDDAARWGCTCCWPRTTK